MPTLIRNALISLALLVIVALLLLGLVMPQVAQHYVQGVVRDRGGELLIEKVRFNPFRTQLTIEDLRLVHGEQEPVQFDRLVIQLSLMDLVSRHIQIKQFAIDGLQLTITEDPEGWRLGNERLSSSSTSDDSDGDDAAAQPLEWTFGLTSATLQNATVVVEQPVQVNQLHARRLQLSNLSLDASTYSGRVELLGTLNDAPLSIDGDLSGKDQILNLYTDLVLNDFSLEHLAAQLPPELLGSRGLLDVASKAHLRMAPDDLRVEIVDTEVQLRQIHLLHAPFQVDVEMLRLSTPSTTVQLSGGALTTVSASILAETGTTAIYHQSEQRLLAQWSQFTSQSLALQLEPGMLDSGMQLRLPEIRWTDLILSHPREAENPLPAFLQAKDLNVQGIHYDGQHFGIGVIAFRDIDANLVLSASRQPLNLLFADLAAQDESSASAEPASSAAASSEAAAPEVAASETTAPEAAAPETKPEQASAVVAQGPSFSLGRLDVTGTNTLTMVDRGVQPEFVRTLVAESFHLDKLDTRKPEQTSPFEFRGSADDYATLQAEGTLQPFAERTNLHLTATLREADLPPLSAYLRQALNYEFESGQLDLQVNLTIKDDQLDGTSRITLRGADLRPLGPEATDAASSPGFIPLNAALSMLEDDKGNVDLDIPLSGDINSPSFSLNGFVASQLGGAILQGASTYAVQALVPYGAVVSVAQLAGKHMLRMRFNPLLLEAGQLPGEAHAEFIQQFQQFMQERKDIQAKICGVATPRDLQLPSDAALTAIQRETLQQLAGSRADAFKREVMRLASIPSARLLTCNGGIDTGEDAHPRVDLKL